jgi:adenylate cyclase
MSNLWFVPLVVGLLSLRRYSATIMEFMINSHKKDEEAFWRSLLTGVKPGVPMYIMRDVLKHFGAGARCKVCNIPFNGATSLPFRLMWSGQSAHTPHFCKKCESFAIKHVGGAEVCMTMVSVDVRDSGRLAGSMTPEEFRDLLNRFYMTATEVLTDNDGWIDKFVGDEAIGLFIPGFAGKDHAYKAMDAGLELLLATGHGSPEGPWIPLGVGVNTGTVYMGTVGTDKVADITALGDEMTVTKRLCSVAEAGELLFSMGTRDAILSSGPEKANWLEQLAAVEHVIELEEQRPPQAIFKAKVTLGD